MTPRKKPEAQEVTVADVSEKVVEAVRPSWSQVASQWATSAGAIAVAVTLLGNIYLQYQQAQEAARRDVAAAEKVEKVAEVLEQSNAVTSDKLDEVKETSDSIHVLVNSNMGDQLRLTMIATRRLAAETQDPDDIEAAELAARLYKAHQAQQEKVDDKRR